jgi:hypothetical protein
MVVGGMALLHREVPVATELCRDLPRLFHEQRMRMTVNHCAIIVQCLLVKTSNLVFNLTGKFFCLL